METLRRRRKDREPLNHAAGMFLATATLVGSHARPSRTAAQEPTYDDIARRAYELYEQRGAAHGRDWEDWFQAEDELRREVTGQLTEPSTNESAYAIA